MINVTVQLFTYDQTSKALTLLKALAFIAHDVKLKAVWTDHAGTRRRASISSLSESREEKTLKNTIRPSLHRRVTTATRPKQLEPADTITLNECYVANLGKSLAPGLTAAGFCDGLAHFNISPDCSCWAHSAGTKPNHELQKRSIISSVVNLERCAEYRKPAILPTVMQVTLRYEGEAAALVPCIREVATRMWLNVHSVVAFGAIDFGGEWLFFPNSGYNPNVSEVDVFSNSAGGKITEAGWDRWKTRHNLSLEPSPGIAEQPLIYEHSLEPHAQVR